MMKLTKQVTGRMEELAEAERRAELQHYAERTFELTEKLIGHEITNKEEVLPLIAQAAERGITVNRLAEILAQAA